MKQLNEYLSTKVTLKSSDFILKDIDFYKWSWKQEYSRNSYIDSCKETVREFARSEIAKSLYPNVKGYEIVEMMYRDTYKAYISIDTDKNEQEINDSYEKQMKYLDKILKETGWGQFEYACLEQGWWAFIAWVINQKYNKN